MQQHINPVRIANSIQQDKSFTGYNILVEGETDVRLYRKFACDKNSKIKVTFGKKAMREVYSTLNSRGFTKMIGIRDADFIRVNNKLDQMYSDNIFLTDSHDSEGMILKSMAFNGFIFEVSKEENLNKFNLQHGCLRTLAYELSYPLACLRYANRINNFGLAFKPVKPEGNTLKFKKFICDKEIKYLGHDKLINTIIDYSTNRGSIISKREVIKLGLEEVINLKLPIDELVNGHDLAEILFIICKKGLKSSSESLNGASSVESMLRLAFSREHFELTELFKSLTKWQEKENIKVFSTI